MVTRTLSRGGRAFCLGAALLFVLLPPVSASARIHHNDTWARREFSKAERMREALNGRPQAERTRKEYQRVIDCYRRVYFGSPASSKADPSVVATAELMVEVGRRFDDDKILRGAIDQYRFLRKEYPGSKYRFDALFTIGEVYKDDLNDEQEARTTFEDFLHRYPRNRLAGDARAAVKAIDAEAKAKAEAKADAKEREQTARKSAGKRRPAGANVAGIASGSASDSSGDGSSNVHNAGNSVGKNTGNSAAGRVAGEASDVGDTREKDAADSATAPSARRNGLPRVTGVRHWSTPDYTRVAIDVEQEVKFASQRISHPDRVFFDLRDTRLASTLVGKTFDVDDGFLKKIRVAEYEPGRTRIVLEVDDVASYDAFLLPDPYRLIIDVHGKETHGGQQWAMGASDTQVLPTQVLPTQILPEAADTRKPGLVETDLAPENVSADAKPSDSAKAASSAGVTKTTVAVKGSNRRIPKTIVQADDPPPVQARVATGVQTGVQTSVQTKDGAEEGEVPATVASLEPEKTGLEVTTGTGEAKPLKPDALPASSSSSSLSVRRKKTRAASNGTATAGLSSGRDVEAREARPTASGDRSLTRALGLKIGKIVIDAGHGGHDTGTIGPNGLLEKDVVLDVAERLGRLLTSRLGAEVIYTRQDDTFIPLETRTAIANRERADLFISIHANSSRDSDARGVETYYLNFTSSPEALEVAARENAVSEKSIYELQDLVKKIALKDKIDESREFAGDVQESLYGGLALHNAGMRNRGVKKAPFIVLIGANMPSILAEISFVSNPTDERKMETSEHRQRIAESLYRGVAKYANGLSGVKVASRIEKPEGQ